MSNSNSVSIICDVTAPVITLNSLIPAYTNLTAFNIALSSSDNLSGIKTNLYQVNGNTAAGFSGTNANISISGLTNGPNTFKIWAIDNAGNTSLTQAVNIYVDPVIPSLSITSPSNMSVWNTTALTITGTTNDAPPSSGIKTFWISNNGADVTSYFNGSAYTFTANATNTIISYIEDNAGNKYAVTNKAIVDTTAPVISNISPTNGQKLATNITVTANVSDNLSGVKQIDLQVIQTNGANFSAYSITPGTSISTNIFVTNLANYYIWFRVIDNAGNTNTTSSNIIYISDIPALSFTSPAVNGSTIITNGLSVTVSGTSSSGWNSIASNIIILNNKQTNSVTGTTWNCTLTLSNNYTNTILAYAVNNNGDIGNAQYLYIIADTNAPVISSVSPSNCFTNINNFIFTLNENNNFSGIQSNYIIIDSNPWLAFTATNYSITSLTDGYHTISIYAVDNAGNHSLTDTVYITNDSAIPTLSLTNPANGLITNTASLIIGGKTNDTSPSSGIKTFWISNNSVSVNTTTFFNGSAYNFTANTTNTLIAYIEDNAGNMSAVTNTIVIDTNAPVISSVSPTNCVTNTGNFTFTLSESDNFSGIMSNYINIDGTLLSFTGTTYSITSLTDGYHTISIYAMDKAGNYSLTDTLSITNDTLPPSLSIGSPSAGLITNTASLFTYIYTNDTTTPSSGIKTFWVSNNGTDDVTPDSGGANHNYTVNATNKLIAYIEDNAGNKKSITNTIVVDMAAPVLSISNITSNMIITNATPINGNAADSLSGIRNGRVSVYTNGVLAASPSLSGTNWVSGITAAEGAMNISVVAIDNAGNTNTLSIPVSALFNRVCVASTGNDANVGNPSSPMQSIQSAIAKAVSYGLSDIWLDASTFTPSAGLNPNSSGFGIIITNSNIRITGGFNGSFTASNSMTILNAGGTLNNAVFISNAVNVSLKNAAVINATNSGIYIYKATNCVISNCVISNNSAVTGGGLALYSAVSNTLSACVILNNTASQNGAGIYLETSTNSTISACIISNNQSQQGGGIFSTSSPGSIFTGCYICYNTVTSAAGGIYLYQYNDYDIITNCFIFNNTSPGNAGGIWLYGNTANYIKISGCNVYSNSAQTGGGIYLFSANYNIISNNNIFNNTAANGGGIYLKNANNNTFSGCIISNNTASDSGGGIYMTNSGLNTVSYCPVYCNTAANYGGGINLNVVAGNVILNCGFFNNTASVHDGGGICLITSSLNTISNCFISNNSSPEGAGIYLTGSPNNLIASNSICYNQNMGVYLYTAVSSNNIISNCNIFNNSHTSGNGGGILFSSSFNQLLSCNVYSNYASGQGGGIASWNNSNIISLCNIYSNSASQYGGGIYISANYNTVTNSSIYNNTASNGGGLYFTNASYNTISNCIISNNTASQYGGGLYLYYANNNTINGAVYANRTTAYNGGGLYLASSTNNTINSIIYNNTAAVNGGGVALSYSSTNIINGAVFSNTATSGSGGGGGVYLIYSSNNLIVGAVYNNTAAGCAGIYLYSSTNNKILGPIHNNTATVSGGGIEMAYNSMFNTVSGEVYSNSAMYGGGLFLSTSSYNTNTGMVYNNTASQVGGGIWIEFSRNNIFSGAVSNNIALTAGGGIYLRSTTNNTISGTISFNTNYGVVTNNSCSGNSFPSIMSNYPGPVTNGSY